MYFPFFLLALEPDLKVKLRLQLRVKMLVFGGFWLRNTLVYLYASNWDTDYIFHGFLFFKAKYQQKNFSTTKQNII